MCHYDFFCYPDPAKWSGSETLLNILKNLLGWISEVGESTTKKAAKREVAFKVLEKLKSLGEEDLKSLE